MEAYIELLLAIGITIDPESIPTTREEEAEDCQIRFDSLPHYDDKNQKYYTTQQIDTYGEQEGEYYVVQSRELIIGTEYENEIVPGQRARKVHRYNRTTRFRYCVTQLLTQSGEVPVPVLVKVCDAFGVKYELTEWVSKYHMKINSKIKITSRLVYDPATIWGLMRKFLKGLKLGLYYNRIPIILCTLGVPGTRCTRPQYDGIMADFKLLNDGFDEAKIHLQIKYFPDLRYVALRLMNKHGVIPKYDIPWLNTKRKIKSVGGNVDFIFESASTDGASVHG